MFIRENVRERERERQRGEVKDRRKKEVNSVRVEHSLALCLKVKFKSFSASLDLI